MKNKVFTSTFHPTPGMADINLENRDQTKNFSKFIQQYLMLGVDERLPPLSVDESLIEKIHEALLATEDIHEDSETIKTMLAALSFWGHEKSLEILEQKLLSTSFKPISFKCNAYWGKNEEIQTILRYYILAIAHNTRFSTRLEGYFLDLLDPDCSRATRKLIYYLIGRHRSTSLLNKLKEIKENEVHDDNKMQLSLTCALYAEEKDLSALFKPNDFSSDEFWGVLLFTAQMSPKRASFILDLCESKKGMDPSKELVWEEIQRIHRSQSFISSLEKMNKQELDLHFRKIGNSSKLWRLWELLYSRMDRYSEIKLLRQIEDLDPCWFKMALVSINSLAASVILIENHNEYEGLYKLKEQRVTLSKKAPGDLSPIYERDFWQGPVENAALELIDSVSLYIQEGVFPSRLFKLLRIMLTVRQNVPWKYNYEANFPAIDPSDLFYCHPKEIYPLIVDTLRRDLFYQLCGES